MFEELMCRSSLKMTIKHRERDDLIVNLAIKISTQHILHLHTGVLQRNV